MILEVYENLEGDITAVNASHEQKHLIVDEGSKLLRTIECDTWEECMIKHHVLMGWEPYKSF
jgi:hypothetical protein